MSKKSLFQVHFTFCPKIVRLSPNFPYNVLTFNEVHSLICVHFNISIQNTFKQWIIRSEVTESVQLFFRKWGKVWTIWTINIRRIQQFNFLKSNIFNVFWLFISNSLKLKKNSYFIVIFFDGPQIIVQT